MLRSKEIIQRTFNASAGQFDEIGTPFFKHFGELLVNFADIQSDECILDIACGRGATTFPLLKKVSDKGRIIAIDISANMIEACRQQAEKTNVHDIDFRVMDAEHLQLDDESMDKVISGFGLFFLSDIEQGLREIKRVLKPGGSMIFSSWNDEYRLTWFNELIVKYLPELRMTTSLIDERIRDADFRTLAGIDRILEKSGFEKKQVSITTLDCFYNDEEEWIKSRWQTAFRMYFEKLPPDEYRAFKNEIVGKLQQYKENGNIRITMSAIFTKAVKSF